MKLLQQCFLFFIVVVILWHNLGSSQVSVYRTIGPTLVSLLTVTPRRGGGGGSNKHGLLPLFSFWLTLSTTKNNSYSNKKKYIL